MIHHQHFFPINNDQGKLLPVFMAVLNMEPDQPEIVSRNMERVLAARLRDAQFFYQSDRQQPLAEHQRRLDTVLFHKKIGTYLQKSDRVAARAEDIASAVLKSPQAGPFAREAGQLCKADLSTDMVRELTELQGPWAASTRGKMAGRRKCGGRFTSITCPSVSKRRRHRRASNSERPR
jgi:glycyl-tRNA synthetase beta chain